MYSPSLYFLSTIFFLCLPKELTTTPCSIELHSYGFDDPAVNKIAHAWFTINGKVTRAIQYGSNSRGIIVVKFDPYACAILVMFTNNLVYNFQNVRILVVYFEW